MFGVSLWTVLGSIAGVMSFVLAAWVAFTGTGVAQDKGVLGPEPQTSVSFSPVPSLSISASPSPFYPPSPTPSAEPTTDEPTPTPGVNSNPSTRFLMDVSFVSGGGYSEREPVTFANTPYDRTLTVYCQSTAHAWTVVGYGTFTATLGVNDAARSAIGTTISATFTNQDNQLLVADTTVSLGKPRKVTFQLKGAVQMQLRCRAKGNEGLKLSLGNAELVR